MSEQNLIEPELLEELHVFENFLENIGFKRIDGAVFGVLVLANRPLSSIDIQSILSISQSAVSQSIKKLSQYNAIEVVDNRHGRQKLHRAKENSLAIVASIFKKREQDYISDVKKMAKRVLKKKQSTDVATRNQRLESIVLTCEIGEAIINFLISITQSDDEYDHKKMGKKLQNMLELLSTNSLDGVSLTTLITSNIAHKIKDGLFNKLTGDAK